MKLFFSEDERFSKTDKTKEYIIFLLVFDLKLDMRRNLWFEKKRLEDIFNE